MSTVLKRTVQIVTVMLLAVQTQRAQPTWAQPQEANYDESNVPRYTLPDPLRLRNGQQVTSAKVWQNQRRGEILELFRSQVYGRCPEPRSDLVFEVLSTEPDALDGKAIRRQVKVSCRNDDRWAGMEILIYTPRNASTPVPVFLGLNFSGNQSVHTEPGIRITKSWTRDRPGQGVVENRATEASRGVNASRWDIESIVSRGYALATIYYGDIDPDFHDGFENGVHTLYARDDQEGDEWGSISAWSWGLSRAMDYFETATDLDHRKVALMGHSRLGKTSLWAGARDPRFAIVISNNSGCGGAALSRRRFGETVARINSSFPHWFCSNFRQYDGDEDQLPVDQHMLISLVAPRPVYVASATGDEWADPRGEFESARQADRVFALLGQPGLGGVEMPAPDQPVMSTIGYHVRTGEHDVTKFDWKCYLDFADKHFGR